jgi:hypothetical protein
MQQEDMGSNIFDISVSKKLKNEMWNLQDSNK